MIWPWQRSRRDAELNEELRSHLTERARRRMALGDSPQEARDAARREFGNVAHISEVTREMWGWASTDRLAQDVRDALRSIRRSPGVAVAAVLSLALGIGANTAIFRVMDALLLRPMPIPAPSGLVTVVEAEAPPGSWGLWPYSYFERFFRDGTPGITGAAATAFMHRPFVTVEGDGGFREPEPIAVALVSGNYFSTLGLTPGLGRLIVPSDDAPATSQPVVVVSDNYWASRFGRSPNVIGRTISIGSTPFVIVGVAPRGFSGDVVGEDTKLWAPIATQSAVMPELPGLLTSDWQTGWAWVRIVARLTPGTTMQGASLAATEAWHAGTRKAEVRPAGLGESRDGRALAEPIVILMATVGLVLLIACANVANLLTVRGLAREREFAVRTALGASTLRIVRQLVLESLLLASVGAVIGVAVSSAGAKALVALASGGGSPLDLDLALDWHVVLFATAVAVATGLIFGLLPARRASRTRVGILTSSGRSVAAMSSRAGAQTGRPSRALVAVQVALSLALLVGARLLGTSLTGLRHVDLGLERTHVLLVSTGSSSAPSSRATTMERYRLTEERVSALPGVVSASPTLGNILEDGSYSSPSENLSLDGTPVKPGLFWASREIGPGYFKALGATVVAGRNFEANDASGAEPVVIVGQTLARFLFGSTNPLGHRIRISCTNCVTETIVGVASDIKSSPWQGPTGTIYMPYRQTHFRPDSPMFVVIRAVGDPMTLASPVRQLIQTIAPDVPILRIETVDARLNTLLATDRMLALLGDGFGALALALACVGLYGVVSYSAMRQRREIGIRLALGATRGQIIRLILLNHASLLGAGLALGLVVARICGGLLAGRLFGVQPQDPLAFASAAGILATVAAVAALVPTIEAARVDPARTLRAD